MTCEDCAFWIPNPGAGGGNCHRYAPRPSDSKLLNQTYWPRTERNAFCGEWQERLK